MLSTLRGLRLCFINATACVAGFLFVATSNLAFAGDEAKKIICDSPASRWQDGMVTGNGLIGAIHYGDALRQSLALNSHKFLLPNGAPFPVPDMADMLAPMRDEMLAGNIGQGWRLYHDEMLRRRGLPIKRKSYHGMVSSQPFHPGYLLHIDSPAVGEVTGYRRWTDYQTGETAAQWNDDRGTWLSRSFTSRTDNVIVTEFIAPDGATIDAMLSIENAPRKPASVAPTVSVDPNHLQYRATYPERNGRKGGYEGATRVVLHEGTSAVDGKTLRIKGAKRVLLMTILDRYRDGFADQDARRLPEKLQTIDASYRALFDRHAAVHQEIFNRVEFSLGSSSAELLLSNEELLASELADAQSIHLALVEKIFYTSRYLFIASSGQHYGPRLSGMFLGSWGAAWAGDYTCDANVNLAVLGGNILNMPECMEGYFQVIERSLPQWREAAKQFYGCRGVIGPVRIDGEVGIPIHCGPYHAHCTATGLGPWLLYPMFEHYLISGDKDFLRKRLYPILKEQALFYEDFLTRTDSDGKVIFVPSNSPENASNRVTPRTSAAINSTMDIAACKHAFGMLKFSEQELGIAPEQRTSQALLAKMPPYLLTEEGALKEWAWPTYGENYRHRHSSHMYTVWPAYEINPENSETSHLVPAVAKALRKRSPKIFQAHDALQRSIGWVRIKNGDEFYKILKHLLENKYLFNSLATSHDPNHKIYNYDAILCLQGLLTETCVFTDGGDEPIIELLPALPDAFAKGRMTGVKGRNRTTINELQWDMNAGTVSCQITSEVDQTVTLICRRGMKSIGGIEAAESPHGPHARRLHLPAGETVKLSLQLKPAS